MGTMMGHTACFRSGLSPCSGCQGTGGATSVMTSVDCALDLSTCYEIDWAYPDCTAFDEPYVVRNVRISLPAIEIPGPRCWSEDDLEQECIRLAAQDVWRSAMTHIRNDEELKQRHVSNAIANVSTASWLKSRQKNCLTFDCYYYTSRCVKPWVMFGSIYTLGYSDGEWQTCAPVLFKGNLEASCVTTKTYKSGQFWRWLVSDDHKSDKSELN